MQYTLLTNQFGGMSYKKDPAAIGPNAAQDAQGVEVSAGVLTPDTEWSFAATGETVSSAGTDGTTVVESTTTAGSTRYDFGNHYTYANYGTRTLRIPRAVGTSGWVVQWTQNTVSYEWQALGIKMPVAGSFAMASGGAGSLTGAYRATVVFYNAYGDESPPVAAVSLTAASNDIDYSAIPIGYGQGDINSSTSITNVDNPSFFRVGMRITTPGGGIPAGTYITAISGSTITISQAATATTANVELQDAQVTGRRIYRTTAGGTTYYLAVDIANVTATTSTGDNTTDAVLEVAAVLPTDTDDDVLPAILGGTVSPDGVLMGPSTNGIAFSKTDGSFLWKSDYLLDIPNAVQCFFGLSRFIVFTRSEIYFVLGSGADDFDIIKTSLSAPVTPGSVYYGGPNPVEMSDGSVWFTCVYGVVRYNGSSIERLTADVFTDAQNASIGANTHGAAAWRDRYFVVTSIDSRTSVKGLVYDPKTPGWRLYRTGETTAVSTAAVWIDQAVAPPQLNYYRGTIKITEGDEPGGSGMYWTGEWSGERRTSLKKFRRVSVLHNGNVTVQPYVDGAVAGDAQALTRSTLGRSTFWLPSGTKGRLCSIKLSSLGSTAEVHEIGVWVGEERGPMP